MTAENRYRVTAVTRAGIYGWRRLSSYIAIEARANVELEQREKV